MPQFPLKYAPGVCKVDSPNSAKGRYTDMDKARFEAGYPEKIGGQAAFSGTAADSEPRGLTSWSDNTGDLWVSIASLDRLYRYSDTGTQLDITPYRGATSSTLTNPLDTTSGSATVTVNHNSHGLSSNDYVLLSTGTAVGGVQPAGIFLVTVVNANSYTITNTDAATGNATGGGGTVSYTYYRVTLGNNPFSTTSGSAVVTVTHSSHGALTNDSVTFSGASAVAGLTLSGKYTLTKVDANTYTVNAGSNANATTTGGGASVTVRYDVSFQASSYGGVVPWALHNYGQQLLASPSAIEATRPVATSTIYVWDPSVNSANQVAYPLYNAPSSCNWMFVTPERFVFALGTTTPMTVQWPDQDDYTDWTPTATNTANSRRLQDGSYLVGGLAVRDGASLVFSDKAVYVFNYTGDDSVYASTLAGNAGLLGPLAVATFNGIAFWMGPTDFWMWNGSLQKIPSDDIRDYVFSDIQPSLAFQRQTVCGVNSAHNEVWFFYNSVAENTGDVSRYAVYHIDQNCWSVGKMKVSSWIDNISPSFPYPLATSPVDYRLYLMEYQKTIQSAFGSDAAYVTFAPVDLSDSNMDMFCFIPDMKRQVGNCTLDIITQQYPFETAGTAGTFTLGTNTTRVDMRIGAKMIGGTITSGTLVSNSDFRLGTPIVEAQPGGARR